MPENNDAWIDDFLAGLDMDGDGSLFPAPGPAYETFRYDPCGYMIAGSDGIDCIVYDGDVSLQELLNQGCKVEGKPLVIDVEMLITGEGAGSIADLSEVRDLGIEAADGADVLRLGPSWVMQDSPAGDAGAGAGSRDVLTFANDDGLKMQVWTPAFSQIDIEVDQTVLTLQLMQG